MYTDDDNSNGDDDDDDDDDDRPSPAKTTTTSACCSRLGMTFYHILYLIVPDTSSCVPGCKQVYSAPSLHCTMIVGRYEFIHTDIGHHKIHS